MSDTDCGLVRRDGDLSIHAYADRYEIRWHATGGAVVLAHGLGRDYDDVKAKSLDDATDLKNGVLPRHGVSTGYAITYCARALASPLAATKGGR